MTGNGNNIGFNFGNFFKTMMPPFFPMMNQNFLSIYTVINQIGLPPIFMGNPNFANSVWGYTQMNSYGDQFICHAGTPGSSTKELSEEDKLIAEDQKKLKEETTKKKEDTIAVEQQSSESIEKEEEEKEKSSNSESDSDETVTTEKAEKTEKTEKAEETEEANKTNKKEKTKNTKITVPVGNQTYYVETDGNNNVTAVYNSKNQKINLHASIKYALAQKYKVKLSKTNDASKIGKDLYINLKGAFSDDEKTVELLKKINKDNVLDVIKGFKDLNFGYYGKDGIIEWLRDDEINQKSCCYIINALLLKAEELNLQESDEFKNLINTAEVYKNNNNEYKIKNPNWTYSTAKAEQIDDCIKKLIEKTKGNPKQN